MVLESPFVSIPAAERVILFGRHKGKSLGSLSSGYLRWIVSQRSLQEGHWTIWADLAKHVLRDRGAFEGATLGLSEQDYEENTPSELTPITPAAHSAPWTKILNNLEVPGRHLNLATYASLLKWCGTAKALSHGKRVHHHIVRSGLHQNPHLGSFIVQMYAECGALDQARSFFDTMYPRNVLAWNLMMKSYAQHGHGKEVLKLFEQMQRDEVVPDRVTILGILMECGNRALIFEGKMVHNFIMGIDLISDVIIGNAIITMYGKCGSLDDALRLFDQMTKYDVITWNSMIAAFGQNGLSQMALHLFVQMQQEGVIPDNITYVSILDACTSQADLAEGRHVHVYVLAAHLESNVVVGTALVNMYGKCGNPHDARKSFDKIPRRNTICWTAMIAAYAQNEHGKDALQLFSLMEQEGMRPTKITFISALDACASNASLSVGEKLLTRIKKTGFAKDVKIGTALVNMFGRCGRVEDARGIFDKMPVRDLAIWNAMIAAYAQHGQVKYALQLFDQMKLQGVRADMITYVSILSVCSRAGLVGEACQLFASMNHDHGIDPIEHHYNCMIDLLARAGRLDEAEHLINDMPSRASFVPVMTLLGACKNQVDINQGKCMAELLSRLGLGREDPQVMPSGIDAAHAVHGAAEVTSKTKKKSVKKQPGSCSVKVGGRLHKFVSDDKSHPLMDEICCEVTRLTVEMDRA